MAPNIVSVGVGALDPKWKAPRVFLELLAKSINFGFRPKLWKWSEEYSFWNSTESLLCNFESLLSEYSDTVWIFRQFWMSEYSDTVWIGLNWLNIQTLEEKKSFRGIQKELSEEDDPTTKLESSRRRRKWNHHACISSHWWTTRSNTVGIQRRARRQQQESHK
jgi:hypothetical protein